jgi:glycosyltransferase A (GT-A) superfamily protein (DUF2064 family)
VSDRLLVFVKAPRPGTVKPRLAAVLGDEAAALLYRAMAEEQIRRTAPRAGEYERAFLFAPEDARAEMESWLPAEPLEAQQGDDLGERMSRAFASAFSAGARRVAIVGTDVPSCGREHVAFGPASPTARGSPSCRSTSTIRPSPRQPPMPTSN